MIRLIILFVNSVFFVRCLFILFPLLHHFIFLLLSKYYYTSLCFCFFSISKKIISDFAISTNISCRSSALALALTKRWAFMHYSSLLREFIWWFEFSIIHDWWHSGWFQQSRLDLMVTENIVRIEIWLFFHIYKLIIENTILWQWLTELVLIDRTGFPHSKTE